MPEFTEEDHTQWNDDMLGVRWQAAEDTTIGGWCVQPEGSSPTHEGGLELASFMTEELAEHIAYLHNEWLERGERP